MLIAHTARCSRRTFRQPVALGRWPSAIDPRGGRSPGGAKAESAQRAAPGTIRNPGTTGGLDCWPLLARPTFVRIGPARVLENAWARWKISAAIPGGGCYQSAWKALAYLAVVRFREPRSDLSLGSTFLASSYQLSSSVGIMSVRQSLLWLMTEIRFSPRKPPPTVR